MNTTQPSSLTRIILLVLPLVMVVGCQLGGEPQLAPTPLPPATPHPLPLPTPTLEERRVQTGPEIGNNTKYINENLHVWYIPCPQNPQLPVEWVAPIILTDLRSGSVVYLNRNGTVKTTFKPEYKTKEGRITLEAALEDKSIVEQIVARPQCP